MKILKKAEQKNVILNREYYTDREIFDMLVNSEIFYFDRESKTVSYNECVFDDEDVFRIFTDKLSEIKVVLDNGFYTNVAIGKNGKTYFVELI